MWKGSWGKTVWNFFFLFFFSFYFLLFFLGTMMVWWHEVEIVLNAFPSRRRSEMGLWLLFYYLLQWNTQSLHISLERLLVGNIYYFLLQSIPTPTIGAKQPVEIKPYKYSCTISLGLEPDPLHKNKYIFIVYT